MNKIGTVIRKNSKEGGGEYVVIGHINCARESCGILIDLRETIVPTRSQRKNGRYYVEYAWCPKCGLFQPNEHTKRII